MLAENTLQAHFLLHLKIIVDFSHTLPTSVDGTSILKCLAKKCNFSIKDLFQQEERRSILVVMMGDDDNDDDDHFDDWL